MLPRLRFRREVGFNPFRRDLWSRETTRQVPEPTNEKSQCKLVTRSTKLRRKLRRPKASVKHEVCSTIPATRKQPPKSGNAAPQETIVDIIGFWGFRVIIFVIAIILVSLNTPRKSPRSHVGGKWQKPSTLEPRSLNPEPDSLRRPNPRTKV